MIGKHRAKYMRIEGDRLIVDVPAGVTNAWVYATRPIDLSDFALSTLEAHVMCRGENVVRVQRPARGNSGVVMTLSYDDPVVGERRYAHAAVPDGGSFSWTNLVLKASFGEVPPSADAKAHLALGLAQASGRLEFDLSSFAVGKAPPIFKCQDNDYRVRYPERVSSLPRMRGVMGRGTCRNTEQDIEDLKNYGANLIRLQMNGFGAKRPLKKGEKAKTLADWDKWLAKNLDHAEEVLGWLEKRGMMMVLDMHNPPLHGYGKDGDVFYVQEYADRFVEAWRGIAVRFKGRKGIYGYDLMNEPMQTSRALPDCDYWNLQRRAAEAIRDVDPDATIIFAANEWSAPWAFAYLAALEMDNVIYQLHMYMPGSYTHQGANGAARPSAERLLSYPDKGKGWDKAYLRRKLEPVRKFQLRHNAKMFVGEFSTCIYSPGAGQYLRDCISIFEEYGWDWTYHSFREARWWDVETVIDPVTGKSIPNKDNDRFHALIDGFKGTDGGLRSKPGPAEDDASRMKSGMMNPGSGLRTVERIGKGEFKVLIYGNSIALHAPKPDIGWTNAWGMAASAPKKDFAHLVVAGLEGKLGRRADYRIRNIAALERNIMTNVATVGEIAADAAWKPDYVVIAIGENVRNVGEANASVYRGFLADLARPFAACGSRVVMRSPFWRNDLKSECTKRAAMDVGAAYVDASALGSKDENKAKGLFWHGGVANHPGDLGMRRLAELILAGFAAPRVARTVRPSSTGFCFNPDLHTYKPLNDDYSVTIDDPQFFAITCRNEHEHVFAVNFDGTRGVEMPVSATDDFLQFDWDTSTLEYATPYFEVVEGDSET